MISEWYQRLFGPEPRIEPKVVYRPKTLYVPRGPRLKFRSEPVTVRFRFEDVSVKMKLPSEFIKDKKLLQTGFRWPSLARAINVELNRHQPDNEAVEITGKYFFVVEAVGWEGTEIGSDLVVHVA